MRKTIISDSDGYKMVHSEKFCGGYVTADDEVELTNYLVDLPNQNYVIV